MRLLSILGVGLSLGVGACSSTTSSQGGPKECVPGDESCACFTNDTCNGNLVCLSDVCVNPGAGGSAGAAGASGSYGAAGESGAGAAGGSGSSGAAGESGASAAGSSGSAAGDAGAAGSAGALGSAGAAGSAGTGGEATPPSCDGLQTSCQGESCCAGVALAANVFPMGRGTSASAGDYYEGGAAWELPEHNVSLSGFTLDKYEVTVGRFRKFVTAYSTGWRPSSGSGAHAAILGSGWDSQWDTSLPSELSQSLLCSASSSTWTGDSLGTDDRPINCVTWYEAMAFCIWDGGYLPTEAEWEYAAAGGDADRLYPWGSTLPSADTSLANAHDANGTPFAPVGSHPKGAGRWGHQDLAGSVAEWVLDTWLSDWYSSSTGTNENVCCLVSSTDRVRRGGDWEFGDDYNLRVAFRDGADPAAPAAGIGFRCARPSP